MILEKKNSLQITQFLYELLKPGLVNYNIARV